jgi:large subunit ribosomal protein L25
MQLLKATTRTDRGTRQIRRLRKEGLTPGVVYGHGKETVSITVSHHDIHGALTHGERVLEINLDGTSENVMIKDVQWDTFGQHILHVDLTRVDLDERVVVTVPVVLRGTPVGVERENGVLRQMVAEISIECTVRSIPDEIRISVLGLNVGEALLVKDLELPEGATLQGDPETMVCNVTVIAELEEAEAEEGEESTQPEVIGEKKEEEPPAKS